MFVSFTYSMVIKKVAVRNRDFHSRYRYFLVMCESDTGTDTDKVLIFGKIHWGIDTDTSNLKKISDEQFLNRNR